MCEDQSYSYSLSGTCSKCNGKPSKTQEASAECKDSTKSDTSACLKKCGDILGVKKPAVTRHFNFLELELRTNRSEKSYIDRTKLFYFKGKRAEQFVATNENNTLFSLQIGVIVAGCTILVLLVSWFVYRKFREGDHYVSYISLLDDDALSTEETKI